MHLDYGAILKVADGSQIVGEDLARVLDEARAVRGTLSAFPTHLPRFVLEQAAIGGVFRRKPNEEGEHGLAGQLLRLPAGDAANLVAARLDAINKHKSAKDPWNLSFSWSAALQMPLFELCRGKSELPLKEMGDLYIAELEKAGAAARGSYARKGKEGDHVAK